MSLRNIRVNDFLKDRPFRSFLLSSLSKEQFIDFISNYLANLNNNMISITYDNEGQLLLPSTILRYSINHLSEDSNENNDIILSDQNRSFTLLPGTYTLDISYTVIRDFTENSLDESKIYTNNTQLSIGLIDQEKIVDEYPDERFIIDNNLDGNELYKNNTTVTVNNNLASHTFKKNLITFTITENTTVNKLVFIVFQSSLEDGQDYANNNIYNGSVEGKIKLVKLS